MIVADKKPIEEIIEYIKPLKKILLLGCNECVTVCEAGGKKEVAVLASALRMYFMNEAKEVRIDEITLERQCDHEYCQRVWLNLSSQLAIHNQLFLSLIS